MVLGEALSSGDRRRHARTAASRPGRFLLPGAIALPVTLADLSAAGARVTLSGVLPANGPLVLVDLDAGQAHACAVAWRKEGQAGVKFLRSANLRGLVPGEFRDAKRVWEAFGGR